MSYTALFIRNFLKLHKGGASEVQSVYSDEKEIVHHKQQNWELAEFPGNQAGTDVCAVCAAWGMV